MDSPEGFFLKYKSRTGNVAYITLTFNIVLVKRLSTEFMSGVNVLSASKLLPYLTSKFCEEMLSLNQHH